MVWIRLGFSKPVLNGMEIGKEYDSQTFFRSPEVLHNPVSDHCRCCLLLGWSVALEYV